MAVATSALKMFKKFVGGREAPPLPSQRIYEKHILKSIFEFEIGHTACIFFVSPPPGLDANGRVLLMISEHLRIGGEARAIFNQMS